MCSMTATPKRKVKGKNEEQIIHERDTELHCAPIAAIPKSKKGGEKKEEKK